MNYYRKDGQMNLSDRIAIETSISSKESFKRIGKLLDRHPSTIAHEIKENRTFIPGNYFLCKDCRFVRQRVQHHICGNQDCEENCCRCRSFDCQKYCPEYVSRACHKFDKPPYVCNNCPEKKLCSKDKYIYSAKHADAAVTRRRSESRQGVRISDEKKTEMDKLVTKLVKKGQPLTHIYAEHEKEMPVCLRTLYNYIDDGELTIKNVDLRRKTGYKQRGKGHQPSLGFANMEFRQCRTYADFEYAMKIKYTEDEVVEMDTVKGALRAELSAKKINVLLLCPGNMDTEMNPKGQARQSKQINKLPFLDMEKLTKKALEKAENGKAVYTPGVFYKFYRIVAKVLPSSIMIHFVKGYY